MRIRPAREADVAALARIAAESYRAAFREILGDEGLALRDVAFFEERFGREWPLLMLAEGDNTILGFHQVSDGLLHMLFLDPHRRGQGVGAALLADAEARGAVELECFRDNGPARRFYERHGWQLDSASEREFAGAVRAFVTYRKGR